LFFLASSDGVNSTQQSRNLATQQSRNLPTQQSRNIATQQSRNLATQQSRNLTTQYFAKKNQLNFFQFTCRLTGMPSASGC
jgi:hypothetical protein